MGDRMVKVTWKLTETFTGEFPASDVFEDDGSVDEDNECLQDAEAADRDGTVTYWDGETEREVLEVTVLRRIAA
ncbi:hypothetical protein [Salininema proteolyticum]|uniref:Uncharacterized protein n=1 Tax=Salininema proteolyticum TaxID=1607685 RepID=A0ABV8U485_9ACTN